MNLSSWLDRRADLAPDRIALVFEDEQISYRALARRAAVTARYLKHELGIARGDRLGLLALNRPDYLTLLFACARLGAMLVPVNWRLAPPEQLFILRDAGMRALILDAEFDAIARLAASELPGCRQIALPLALGDLPESEPDDRSIGYDAPLLIVYTSGTTGHPKGAVLTQNALLWNAFNSIAAHDLSSRDRVLITIPMFHVGGLNMQTVPALHAGATVHLHRRFDPAATLAAIRDARITVTVLVPASSPRSSTTPTGRSPTCRACACSPPGLRSCRPSDRAVARARRAGDQYLRRD